MPYMAGLNSDVSGKTWDQLVANLYSGSPAYAAISAEQNPSSGKIPASTATGGVTGSQAPLNYNAATGGTPVLPSPGSSAGVAVQQNLGNLDDILKLVGQTNAANLESATAPYLALPGYQSSLANVGANIGQMTAGQLPADVQNQIAQAAAERGVAQGGYRNADYLKALGLNSLQMQQQGQAALNSATAALPKPAILNPASMFVSPQEQQQAAAAQSLYNAAPVPSQATNAALAASQRGQAAGNQPSSIVKPSTATATGNDTLAAVQDLLKRYSSSGSEVNPTQGFGSLSPTYDPSAALSAYNEDTSALFPGEGPSNLSGLGGSLDQYLYGSPSFTTNGESLSNEELGFALESGYY